MAFSRLVSFVVIFALGLSAHDVSSKDALFLVRAAGAHPLPFFYLGAKHMFTGYDHVLFLLGVVFFLYRLRDVALYVTCFAVGHSMTLVAGVLGGFSLNPAVIDAAIGFSVFYKAFDNLRGFESLFGRAPNPKLAVLVFGWIHGFGLASRLLELQLPSRGLLENLIAFNIGVEAGQLLALAVLLAIIAFWRARRSFAKQAIGANIALMTAGLILSGFHLTGYFLGLPA